MGKEDFDLHRNLIFKSHALFSSTVRHIYAFIFKGVIKNSIGLYVMLYASGLIVKEHYMVRHWSSRKSTGPGCGRPWFRFQLCFFVSSASLWKEFNSLKLQGSYNDSSAYNWNVYVYIKLKEGVYVKTLQNCKGQFYYVLLYIIMCNCSCFS